MYYQSSREPLLVSARNYLVSTLNFSVMQARNSTSGRALMSNHTSPHFGQQRCIQLYRCGRINLVNKGFRGKFSCGTRQVVPSGQDGSILPARVANHSTGFNSSCPLAELASNKLVYYQSSRGPLLVSARNYLVSTLNFIVMEARNSTAGRALISNHTSPHFGQQRCI